MLVFVIQTGMPHLYPPHGLRVGVADDIQEMRDDIAEFFADEDIPDRPLKKVESAKTLEEIAAIMPELARDREWSLVDPNQGYAVHPAFSLGISLR